MSPRSRYEMSGRAVREHDVIRWNRHHAQTSSSSLRTQGSITSGGCYLSRLGRPLIENDVSLWLWVPAFALVHAHIFWSLLKDLAQRRREMTVFRRAALAKCGHRAATKSLI